MRRRAPLCRALAALALLAAGCAARRGAIPPAIIEARGLYDAEKYSEAAARLNDAALRALPARHLPRGYELLGRSQEKLGQTDSALRTYQVGVAQFPKDVNLLTYLGDLLHHGGLDAQARPFYERILKLAPTNAAAHLGLAESEHELGFLDRAAAHYEAALKSWGDQPSIWLAFAEVLSRARQDAKALEAAGRALGLADTAQARVAQARILWRLNRRAEAFDSLAQAQTLEPARVEFIQQRGLWSLEAGDLERAESAAAAALKLSTNDPLALWLRAAALLRRGKTQEARRDLELAANQDSSPFVAAAAQGVLKQLQ